MIITIKEYKATTFSTNRKHGKAKTNIFLRLLDCEFKIAAFIIINFYLCHR